MADLFSPYKLAEVELKNRIVMSPMCTYSCTTRDGVAKRWHHIHYGARASGQVGMIVVEATAVSPEGRISPVDLGLWDDKHIAGMQELAETIKSEGSVAAIQLGHAGRKAGVPDAVGPSAVAFNERTQVPREMTVEDIEEIILSFSQAARRAKTAGFDVIELHGAHGYLINQFLSPLANKRTDSYGGTLENRYRLLNQVIQQVKQHWSGPLMVRLSVEEYHQDGNHPGDYVTIAQWLKQQGVDLADCSSGGVVQARIKPFPGYQVPYAEKLRRETGIATGAVGLITSPLQAEEIVANHRAELVFLGRELLRNPNWPLYAARELGVKIKVPDQYQAGWPTVNAD